jgi:cephalosporin hydroxylase
MKIVIDDQARSVTCDGKTVPLYSEAAFTLISDLWLKVGFAQKYSYTFTWFGVPIIQLPEDVLRYQEVVFRLQPDVIVETGIAHGGSAVFSASLLKLIGKGRVIAVDVDIRPQNRARLEAHPLKSSITLIEGSSTAPDVVARVKNSIRPGESVLVILDSNHSHAHVTAELEAYASLVTPASYIVAADGYMRDLADVPGGDKKWLQDNPSRAALEFAAKHPDFVIEEPAWIFNESNLRSNITYWPNAWLKRIK